MDAMTIPSGSGKKGEEVSAWLINDTLLATYQHTVIDENLSENSTIVQASELTFCEDEPISIAFTGVWVALVGAIQPGLFCVQNRRFEPVLLTRRRFHHVMVTR
jgi:hypothetical protein